MAQRLFGAGVSAEGVGITPLRPTPIPGSTYVRPPHYANPGGQAMQIADALSSLNGALLQFGTNAARLENDPNSQANKDFQNSLYGKTPEELAAMMGDGATRSRFQQDALSSLLGVKAAEKYQTDTTTWANTEFDQANGNMTEELAARQKAIMDSLPNDAARAAFYKATEQFNQTLIHGDTKNRLEAAVAQRNDAILSQYDQIARAGLNNQDERGRPQPLTADQIAGQIFAAGKANMKFAALSGPEQNGIIFSLAQKYADQGRTDLVQALLTNKRGDVPPIADTQEWGTKSASLIAHSQEVQRGLDAKQSLSGMVEVNDIVMKGGLTPDKVPGLIEKFPALRSQSDAWWAANIDQSARQDAANKAKAIEAQNKDATARLHDSQYNEAITQAVKDATTVGGFAKIGDSEIINKSGDGTSKVTRQDKIDAVVQIVEDKATVERKTLIDKGATPEQADAQVLKDKLAFYAGTGYVNPAWERQFSAIATGASPAIANGGNVPPEVLQTAKLYTDIYASHPAYAAKLVAGDKDARDFFERYRIATQDPANPLQPADAIKAAAGYVALPAETKASITYSTKDLEDAAKKMNTGIFFKEFPGWEPNVSDLSAIKELAKTYASGPGGMSPSKALEQAAKDIADTSVSVNGRLVRSNDRYFPPDFVQNVTGLLDQYAAQHGADEGITSGSDLTVAPMPSTAGKWIIIHKADGTPVATDGVIDTNSIDTYRQAQVDAATRAEAAAGMAREKAPALHTPRDKPAPAPNPTTEQAKAYLTNKAEAKKADAFVAGDANRKGYDKAPSGRWVNPKSLEVMEPVVTWTDKKKSVEWKGTGTFTDPNVPIEALGVRR